MIFFVEKPTAQKEGPKRGWAPTQGAFHRLLLCLDEESDSGGHRYLEIRRRLVLYFDRKNCRTPDEFADETLNRVTRRLEEEGAIIADAPAHYDPGSSRLCRALAGTGGGGLSGLPSCAEESRDQSDRRRSGRLKASGKDKTFHVRLPAGSLISQNYVVEPSGISATGLAENAGSNSFKVVKQ